MRFFRLARREAPDGARLANRSCPALSWNAGVPLEDFRPPVALEVERPGALPTFFDAPAWVARRSFADALARLGVANIETWSVTLDDYVLLNVLGHGPAEDREVFVQPPAHIFVSERIAEGIRSLGLHDVELIS